MRRFWAPIFATLCCLSVVIAITCLHFNRARHGQKSGICRWNFDAICHSSKHIIICGFRDHPYRYFRLSAILKITVFVIAAWSILPRLQWKRNKFDVFEVNVRGLFVTTHRRCALKNKCATRVNNGTEVPVCVRNVVR